MILQVLGSASKFNTQAFQLCTYLRCGKNSRTGRIKPSVKFLRIIPTQPLYCNMHQNLVEVLQPPMFIHNLNAALTLKVPQPSEIFGLHGFEVRRFEGHRKPLTEVTTKLSNLRLKRRHLENQCPLYGFKDEGVECRWMSIEAFVITKGFWVLCQIVPERNPGE